MLSDYQKHFITTIIIVLIVGFLLIILTHIIIQKTLLAIEECGINCTAYN